MKKISGVYVDNEGFRHTVFYDKSKRNYTKMIHNPEGKFCSSAEYTKEQTINQVEGMKKLTPTQELYLSKN